MINRNKNPVLLMAGEFWQGSSEVGLANGMRTLGWAVQEVNRCHFGVEVGRSLSMRIASRLFRKFSTRAYQRKILDECLMLRPQMLLTVKGSDLDRKLLKDVKAMGIKTVMYYPDLAFNHAEVHEDSFDLYDVFVTTKSFQVPWLREHLKRSAIAYVPHGYVGETHAPIFKKITETDYTCDVRYAGNHSAYKQRWLQQLIDLDPNIDLEVIGRRWREQSPGLLLPDVAIRGELTGINYAREIQTAKINVAFHFGPTNSDWQDLVSTRTFEIPACAGFMLHIDNDEIREFFIPGVDIDVFTTAEELHEKIKFYLARPDLREKMIARAYQKCVPAYSYARRAEQIMQAVEIAADGASLVVDSGGAAV